MAAKALTIAVVFKAIDQMLGPARKMLRSIEDVDSAARKAKGLRAMGDDVKRLGEGMQKLGVITGGAGLGAAHALGLTALPGQAVDAQHQLRAMGNVANLTAEQLAGVRLALRGVSRDTNQLEPDLLSAIAVLTASGLPLAEAMRNLPVIGKTATGEVAAITDVSKTAFALLDNLKVKDTELADAIDALSQAGKEGRFELAAMAQYFPMLTASASMLGMKGVPAVTALGAALQIAMKGAGDPSAAANNLQNFLSKVTAPETVRNFAKFGVNLKDEMDGALARGVDPILHIVQLVDRLTNGDQFKLGTLFGDMQVLSFLKPMLANLREYERIKASSANARGGVDRDYVQMLGTTKEQWKQLRILMATTVEPGIDAVLGRVNSILTVINRHPFLQKSILWATGLAIGLGVVNFGLGSLIALSGSVIGNIGTLTVGASALKAGWLGAGTALKGGPRVLALIASGLRVATGATVSWTAALLTNPITWIVAALAGSAYLIYRNWGAIVGFLSRTARVMRSAGANLVGSLWDGMRSMASKPVEAIRSIVQRIRNHLPFSPAKEGPLRDLHRIRLVETIAAGIRPEPLVRAMRIATAAVSMAALSPQATYLPAAARSAARGGGGAAGGVVFSPVVHVTATVGRTDDLEARVQGAIRAMMPEVERRVAAIQARRERGDFRS